ncbi:MAG: CGGC domain-containing protein, partial [Bacteroidales bacterium]
MKIGIIICGRYKDCAGGKCFRAMQNREGAFSVYPKEIPLEIAGYVSCGGCPGVNIEYAPAEMIKNGAEVIHLATGMV